MVSSGLSSDLSSPVVSESEPAVYLCATYFITFLQSKLGNLLPIIFISFALEPNSLYARVSLLCCLSLFSYYVTSKFVYGSIFSLFTWHISSRHRASASSRVYSPVPEWDLDRLISLNCLW